MRVLKHLFERNAEWAAGVKKRDPGFFDRLAAQQKPAYMWIGCSDSRVPANEIVDLPPGEVFVHRNVANLVLHTDLNVLSALQFAVEALKIKHVIVCGHYGCGGVKAAMGTRSLGLMDNWLIEIKDLHQRHRAELAALSDAASRLDRLCELNVAQQVARVCHTPILQKAWRRGQEVSVHGWIYDLRDGLLKDLGLCVSGDKFTSPIYRLGEE